jgi:hypothetical protein
MCVHTWKKEDFKVVGKAVIEVLPQLPKGTTLVYSMTDARQTGAWCVYDTDKPSEVKALLDKHIPQMTSEMLPIIQFFPPSADIYKILHILAS